MRNHPSDINGRRSAFTLLELLIVIGIILVLIGILVPVAAQVKKAAQNANTRQMIVRLEAGIQAYYSDFQSFPGPFFNYTLKPFAAVNNSINTPPIFLTESGTPVGPITSSENLFLGLVGGLAYNGTTFTYSPLLAENRNGPANLNLAAVKRYQSYITVDRQETSLKVRCLLQPNNADGLWSTSAAGFTGDTIVPEFLDKYPRPMPILYMRATRGAGGFLGVLDSNYENGVQYDYEQVTKTYSNDLNYYNGDTKTYEATFQKEWPIAGHETDTFRHQFPVNGTLAAGFPSYFGNGPLSTVSPTVSKKDEFILISAGADGRYGTSDDITNFR